MNKLPIIICLLITNVFFAQVPSYYSNIDFGQSGETLKTALTNLISGHTEYPYSSSNTDTWDILQQSDIFSGDNVLLIYGYSDTDSNSITDRLRDKDDECSFSGSCNGYWNREHVYPKSLADPVLIGSGASVGAGADLHNLRAADAQMNSTRNNNLFETGSGNSGLTDNGFYPGDEYKGDVARIIMYMYTRYPSQCPANDVGYGNKTYNSNIPDIFLDWNELDPVSDFETSRNNKIAEYQGNRNPFIDNPFLAYLIWGGPSISDSWGTTQNPRISLSSSSSEDETNTTFNITIGVTMTSYDAPVSVSVSVNNSSTVENEDYSLNTTSINFNDNETQYISLDINNDNETDDEKLILDLSITSDSADPDTAILVVNQHTINIIDDEYPLIITEIADPNNSASSRYVEIYNSSNTAIDLSKYYLIRWTNAGANPGTKISLSTECGSSLAANTFCIISNDTNSGNNFLTTYGFNPHGKAGTGGPVDSNGDDNIAIVTSASGITYTDPSTWTVIDLYGVPGTDGSDQDHEFEDGRAERKASSTTPSTTWDFNEWNINNDGGDGDGAQNAPDGYDPGYWIGATTIDTWNGLSSNSWGTGSNWASGNIPVSGDNVFIRDSGTDPVISTTGNQITDITVESSASLSIEKGKNLTISENFTNNGTVTLNSDSDEFASLIVQGTSSGNITYKRFVSDEGTDEWDLIGSPVVGQTISNFISANSSSLATSGSNYAIGVFSNDGATDTASAMYTYVTSSSSGNLTDGIGYAMASDDTDSPGTTLDFTGTVNTSSNVTVAIDDQTGTLTNFGKWNLIANPYPSFINANSATSGTNFMTTNVSNLHSSYAYIYGYDGDGTWTLYNNSTAAATYIAPGQAFFVASDDSGGNTVTFSEAMQTVSGTDDFIAGDIVEDSFELILKLYEGDTEIDYTRFYFEDGLNLFLDPGYDAGHFNQEASLMSRLLEEDEGVGFVINAMGLENVNDAVIPLVINREVGDNFRISIDTFGIYAGSNVYLEDNQNGTMTLLNEEDFELTPENDLSEAGRFFIHLTADTFSIENEVETNLLNVFKADYNNFITVEGLSMQSGITNVKLYGLLGREILSTSLNNLTNTQIISTETIATGVYVIKLQSGNTLLTKKLIIK